MKNYRVITTESPIEVMGEYTTEAEAVNAADELVDSGECQSVRVEAMEDGLHGKQWYPVFGRPDAR